MRRLALLGIAAVTVALVVPTGSASAMGGTLTGSFLCENTLVTATGTAGTVINAVEQEFVTIVDLPDSADAVTGATAEVTIVAAPGGAMPLSPPVDLPGVTITGLQVRLDAYRSTTNSAGDISPAGDMASGSAPLSLPTYTQSASTSWDLPDPFQVSALVTGAPGERAWVRVKQFSFAWQNAGQNWNGTTTCRLAAEQALPTGPTTVEQPIFGALTPLSRQYPVTSTDVDLAGTEAQLRAQFADRVTFTGVGTPPLNTVCTVTDPSGCATGQNVTATVTAGTLSLATVQADENPDSLSILLRQPSSGAPFTGAPTVQVSASPQVMEGPLNPVTVTDVRGSVAGWSLTAQLSGPFVEIGNGQIPASAASILDTQCQSVPGSASNETGTGGNLSSAVTLCLVQPGVDDSSGQSGSGQYTAEGRVELVVPPFTKVGSYAAVMQLTLA